MKGACSLLATCVMIARDIRREDRTMAKKEAIEDRRGSQCYAGTMEQWASRGTDQSIENPQTLNVR